MFLRSANHLMTFLLSYYVWETSKIQVTFRFKRFSRLPKYSFLDKKSSKFIRSRAKVAGRSHDQRFIVNFIVMSRNVMSCHVMPRHVASCNVMLRQVTSCYVMSRNFTSCHVMPRHVPYVTSCHVMSRHVMSCHVMSRHVMSRHVTSCHVMPRHVMSRHVTSCHVMLRHITSKVAGPSHDQRFIVKFFHTQIIQIKQDRVRWLSRRLPIPYRISGI